ncbi:uncharacterized protein LOC129718326 isoform X2 [Wyeomyia smithii]|uniref:uncharacterized protein LOC129718326 isoform X2 n=1 Tax=Wyeomyia smithii TaxID=174621 RepID=UPI002467C7B9|nr:uncharacterized protein LOC129718326 isoform X2 [Wyeomyia smithii]
MEQVKALLDAESFQKLKAQKIDDISLVLLKDNDLRDIGINEKGPRVVILQIIENLNSSHDNVNDKENTTIVIIPPSKQILRETLVSDNSFRLKVLQPVLDRGNIPDKNGISFLTRVACQPFEKRIENGHVYPSTEEQQKLANDIVELFPQLQCNNDRPEGAPDSWLFFGETVEWNRVNTVV